MRHPNEDDDTDGSRILSEIHTDVAMEQPCPFLRRGEEYSDEHSANGANDGIEEGGEGKGIVGTLELLDGFVEVDNRI